ncbi:MAG: class I SAM-dependent methyltransferase [Vicinamibacterales bacterium]
MTTPNSDKAFTGSVPHVYETHLVPLLFEDYADDMVRRVAAAAPVRILELAAGTGVVTRRLAKALPEASIVATDVNQAMLDEAAAVGTPRPVEWRQADATSLPFADGSFDAVVCQFGVMFFPDKATAHGEVWRVLAPGGLYVFSVWDRLDANEFADLVHEAVAAVFPENPPRFLARAPYGYFDLAVVRRDLAAGGFTAAPHIETIALRSRAPSPRGPAMGYCQGSPLRAEIEARDPARLALVTDTAAEAIAQRFGRGAVEAGIRAHVVTVGR